VNHPEIIMTDYCALRWNFAMSRTSLNLFNLLEAEMSITQRISPSLHFIGPEKIK